ncbi:ATP-binding cassette, subfamily F, uup [Spirosomataceae bacterium TFI 002]|nr:ATP-binding cassette, subfamily F, uup [Spirosomataceae bacterium TFI 002]
MNYLSAENIGRDLGERWLFKGLTFGVLQGEKIALIGSNGCGKSTMLDILAGKTETDGGEVSIRKDIRFGFLEQDPEFDGHISVMDTIFFAENDITKAIKDYEKATKNNDIDLLGSAIERLDSLNGWDYEAKVQQILSKLGIENFESKMNELSGGQKKRVALAKVLIEEPDFVILDEPTNHLDLSAIEWLEGYLSTNNMTLLLVTHDRYFLDKVCNRIMEISNGQIYKYEGNYAYFLEKKDERMQLEAASYEKNKNRLTKELEWMRRQPKARTTKAQYRIDAFHELKDKTKAYKQDDKMELSMKTERMGKKILEINYVTKSYGEKELLKDFSYTFKRGDKIGIVGPNGVGKSTLLDIVMGLTKPDSGKVIKGETIKIGYFSQSGLKFDLGQKVIDSVREIADYVKMGDGRELSMSGLLSLFLFPPKVQHQPIQKLSGGEKRRLQLLKVLAKSPNFLILDEPTNDLDIDTLNVLEEFLESFSGCLLVVSHDRYFMDRIVDHIFAFEGETVIKDFPGNYTEYRIWKDEEEQEERQSKKTKKEPDVIVEVKPEVEKKKLSYKEKVEFETIEKEIAAGEIRKEEIIAAMNGGETDFEKLAALGQELQELKDKLEENELRWLELSEYSK